MDEEALIARLNMIGTEIRHEDDLISQRMSWLVISQSFLCGTFATLVGRKSVAGPAAVAIRFLLALIPLVGVFLPVLVLLAMGAASSAISQWQAEHDRIRAMPEAKQLDWPRLKHRRLVTVLGQSLPTVVSVGFLLAWLAVVVRVGIA